MNMCRLSRVRLRIGPAPMKQGRRAGCSRPRRREPSSWWLCCWR